MEVPLQPIAGPWRDLHLRHGRQGGEPPVLTTLPESERKGHVATGCTIPCPTSSGLHILVCRVHADDSCQLEMEELCTASLHCHSSKLRLHFPQRLTNHICFSHVKSEAGPTGHTASAAFVIGADTTLFRIALDSSDSVHKPGASALEKVDAASISEHELAQRLVRFGPITCLTAESSWLCLGSHSGVILCISFEDFEHGGVKAIAELRASEPMMQRLRGIMNWGRAAGPVQSVAIRKLGVGRAAVYAVVAGHAGGLLRVWDVQHHRLLLSLTLTPPASTQGSIPDKWWVQEEDAESVLRVALHHPSREASGLSVYDLNVMSSVDGINISGTAEHAFTHLPEGDVIDATLLDGAFWLWLLPPADSMETSYRQLPVAPVLVRVHLTAQTNIIVQCRLLEQQLASALLLESGPDSQQNAVYSQLSVNNSVLADAHVSELMIQRMTSPGIFFREEILNLLHQHKRTADGDSDMAVLKRELKAAARQVEVQEQASYSAVAEEVQKWQQLSVEYLQIFQNAHEPYCLVVNSSSKCLAVVRRSSVSMLRDLDMVEQLMEPLHVLSGPTPSTPTSVLQKCSRLLRLQLGSLAMAALQAVQPDLVTAALDLQQGAEAGLCQGEQSVAFSREMQQEQHRKKRLRAHHLNVEVKSFVRCAGGWKAALDSLERALDAVQWVPPNSVLEYQATNNQPTNQSRSAMGSGWLIAATRQVEGARTRAVCDLMLLLAFIAKRPSQVGLASRELSRVQLNLLPRAQELLSVSQLLLWLCETRTMPSSDDYMPDLSSLGIDGETRDPSSGKMEGKFLAELVLPQIISQLEHRETPSFARLAQAANLVGSYLRWGKPPATGNLPPLSRRAIVWADELRNQGQFAHVETLLSNVEKLADTQHSWQPKYSGEWVSIQTARAVASLMASKEASSSGEREHLTACSISYFFRAAAGVGCGGEVDYFLDLGVATPLLTDAASQRSRDRLHYFNFVMECFSQAERVDAVGQFAYAALQELKQLTLDSDASTEQGQLWDRICNSALQGLRYEEAFYAIKSNPDQSSHRQCLRQFVGALCDNGKLQLLCGFELPFGNLSKIVADELTEKAEQSDVNAQPNLYRVLYAFHTQRHNWRCAAHSMYRFAHRLKNEASGLDALRRRDRSLGVALTALQLLPAEDAWLSLEASAGSGKSLGLPSPTKRLRVSGASVGPTRVSCADVMKEKALTSALLQLASLKPGESPPNAWMTPEEALNELLQAGLFPTALSLASLMWTGSALQSQLEKIFATMAMACCNVQREEASSSSGPSKLLEPTADIRGQTSVAWQQLRKYLEIHARTHLQLQQVVASTILAVDSRIQLPQWLVAMFKDGPIGGDVAALLRIFLNANLLVEAATLAVQHLQSSASQGASMGLTEVQKRKALGCVWMPYKQLDLLRSQLTEAIHTRSHEFPGTDLQALQDELEEALNEHLQQVKFHSDDLKALGGDLENFEISPSQ